MTKKKKVIEIYRKQATFSMACLQRNRISWGNENSD